MIPIKSLVVLVFVAFITLPALGQPPQQNTSPEPSPSPPAGISTSGPFERLPDSSLPEKHRKRYHFEPWKFIESEETNQQLREQVSKLKRANVRKFVPLQFLLYDPTNHQYAPPEQKQFPLIMFLHGTGEHPPFARLFNQPKFFDYVIHEQFQRANPCFVFAPQDYTWWQESSSLDKLGPRLARAVRCLDELCQKYPIDQSRLYATGVASGGFGCYRLAYATPNKFAALFPTSSRGSTQFFRPGKRLTPIWQHEGKGAKTSGSLAALKRHYEKGGAELRSTVYPGSWACWNQAFVNQQAYDWLFRHKLAGIPPKWASGELDFESTARLSPSDAVVIDGLSTTRAAFTQHLKQDDYLILHNQSFQTTPEVEIRFDRRLEPVLNVYYSVDGVTVEVISAPAWRTIDKVAYQVPANSQFIRLDVKPGASGVGAGMWIEDFLVPALPPTTSTQITQIKEAGGEFAIGPTGNIETVVLRGNDWASTWDALFTDLRDLKHVTVELKKGALSNANLETILKNHQIATLSLFQSVPFEGWTKLTEFRNLNNLVLDVPGKVTDFGFTALPSLQRLDLWGRVEINNQNAGQFVGPNLRSLNLPSIVPKISKATADRLKQSHPKLTISVNKFLN